MSETGQTKAAASSAYTANHTLNRKISHVRSDITKLRVDAIVNAANHLLLGGRGVDGAIHRAAGYGLYQECFKLHGCETGSAKITNAYNLPCRKVIHAVGPVYHSRQQSEPLLRGCYRKALELAVENECKSIAFSAISTGVYGYPSAEAADAAISEVRSFLTGPDGEKIEKVVFCSFEQKDVKAYNETLPKYFPSEDDPAGEGWSPSPAAAEPADERPSSESLAASLPQPPTTEPKLQEEPMAKKQKVETNPLEDGARTPRDENVSTAPSQNIEEEWENIGKDKALAEIGPESKPLDEEPAQVEGKSGKMTKVLDTDAADTSQAPDLRNMLNKDW